MNVEKEKVQNDKRAYIKEGLRGFFLKNKNQADLPIKLLKICILILSTKIQKAQKGRDKPKVPTNRPKRD